MVLGGACFRVAGNVRNECRTFARPPGFPPRPQGQRQSFHAHTGLCLARGQRSNQRRTRKCLRLTSWSARAARRRSPRPRPPRLRAARCAAVFAPAFTPPPRRSRTRLCVRLHVCASTVASKLPPTSPVLATTSRSTPLCSFVVVV